MNSKDKGKRGELLLCKKLKEFGYDVHRSQQYCGKAGDADVIGLPGIHCEVKNVEKLNIWNAMSQAISDSKGGKPTVFHKKNNHDWLVTMRLSDWIELYRAWEVDSKNE